MKNINEKINSFLMGQKVSKEEFDDFKNVAEYTNFNENVLNYFRDIHNFELVGWRNKFVTQKICDILLNDEPKQIYALFCPSYKKGIGQVGFRTDDVGDTSKNGIKKLKILNDITRRNGFETLKPKAIFFDIALEQPEKTKFMIDDLKKNIDNFKSYLTSDIEFSLLSEEYPELMDIIGYDGIITVPLQVNDDVLKRVIERGKKFYQLFGWDNTKIENRSKVIVSSEAIVGTIIRYRMQNSIMLYTPTMLERAQVYSGRKQNDPLALIVPKKDQLTIDNKQSNDIYLYGVVVIILKIVFKTDVGANPTDSTTLISLYIVGLLFYCIDIKNDIQKNRK